MKLALALLHMPQSKQSLWSTGEMEEQQGIQEPQYAGNAGLLLPAKIKQIHFYTAQIQGITSTCNNWGDIFEWEFGSYSSSDITGIGNIKPASTGKYAHWLTCLKRLVQLYCLAI